MNINKVTVLIVFISLTGLLLSGWSEITNGKIETICLRESDTLHVRIHNNSNQNVYVPVRYLPTSYIDDTKIHLEVKDRPEYNKGAYYTYKNLFPFPFVTNTKINGVEPDTTEFFVKQTDYYNQFVVPEFYELKPDSVYYQKIVFKIPKGINSIKLAYYTEDFHSWSDKKVYTKSDFIKFDSLFLGYSKSDIVNTYYVQKK